MVITQLGRGVRRHFAGFTAANFRLGLQLLLGWAATLAVAAPSGVWDRLSNLGASPAIILVMYSTYLQGSTGATMLVAGIALAGAVVAAGLGFIPVYLAFAAAGGSWAADGAAKGSTLLAVSAALFALLAVARMRFEAADPFLYVLLLLLSAFCFSAYWVPTPAGPAALPTPPWQMSYTMLLICALPLAVVLPVSWLVWPQPAGRQAKGCFCRLTVNVGALAAGTVEALVGQQAQGEEAAARLRGLDDSIREDLGSMKLLLLLSHLELDVYGRQRVLPAQAFKRATASAAAAATALAQLLRWIQHLQAPPGQAASPPADLCKGLAPTAQAPTESAAADAQPAGKAATLPGSPHFEVCRQLAPQLLALAQALQGCCSALAAVVAQKQRAEAALSALEQLESRCAELGAAAAGAHGGSRSAVAVFLLARGLLFVSCRWVRDMYAAVAAAVEGLQPGSKAAVAAHLDRTYWGTAQQTTAGQLTGGDAGTEAERGSEESEAEEAAELLAAAAEATPCTKGLGRSSSSSSDGSCSTGLAHTPSKVAEASAGNILRPTAHSTGSQACPAGPPAVKAAAHPLRRALDWAGLGPLQLKPALHMGLLIALAGSLVVVRPVYEALGSSTDWVIITVIAASERSSGRSRIRAANRLVGTCAGIAWSAATLGLAYCINGLSFDNSPAKYVAMAVLVSLWGGLVGLCRGRYKRLDYAWTVMGVTVPIVCVESFKSQQPFDQAKWRMVCVCIGIALELAVTSCVFPVTTDALLSDKLGAALAGAAQLAQGVAAREADSLCRDARGAAGAAGAAKGRSSAEAVAGSQQLHPAGCEDGGRAAEAGEAWQRQLPLQGGDMQIQPLPGGGAPSFALVQECADEVRAALARLAALSSYSTNSPLPLPPAAQRRHAAALAAKEQLRHLVDGLQLIACARQDFEAGQAQRRQQQGWSPLGLPQRQCGLVLAVGAALAGSLRALRQELLGGLPVGATLCTLPALDALLRRLAAASGEELEQHSQMLRQAQGQQQQSVAMSGRLAVPHYGAVSLLPITAVALGAGPLLRALHRSCIELLLAGDPAALLQAAQEEACAERDSSAALLAAQKAAIAGAVRTLT